MEKYKHLLELLPNQARPKQSSFSIETTFTSPRDQSTSPHIMPMEPSILAPLEEPSDHIGSVNHDPTSQILFGFLATDSQQAFIPNSSVSSTSHVNHLATISTTTADVEIGSTSLRMMTTQLLHQYPDTSLPASMASETFDQPAYGCPPQQLLEKNLHDFVGGCPLKQQLEEQNNLYYVVDGFPPPKKPPVGNFHLTSGCPQNPQQQQVPLMGYNDLKNQAPCINIQQNFFSFHGSNLEHLNPTGNPMDPNWEAVNSYLLGKVRPAPDIARIYKCSICGTEFPSAQAFGGHMSAHRQTKKREKLEVTKHQFKNVELKPSYLASKGVAIVWPSSKKLTPLKKAEKENNDMMDKEKFECKSEEPMSSSFI